MSNRGKINSLLFASMMAVPMTGVGLNSVNALSVTPNNNSSSLVNTIIGSGITVNNSSFIGAPLSAGTFSGGSGSIGIDEGIIFTTGNVNLAPGPNNSSSAGQNNGLPGDGQLSALIGASTFDAN